MKTKRFELRLSVEQYANLKKLAKDAKVSMSDWLLSSSELDSIGTCDDAPELLSDIDEAVRTREEPVRTAIKKDAPVHAVKKELNEQLKPTNIVATVETIEKIDKLTMENLADKGRRTTGSTVETYGENKHTIENVPTGEKGSLNVMTKNLRTKIPVDIKSTEKAVIEYAGEKPARHPCTICKTPIKKGFLCTECMK